LFRIDGVQSVLLGSDYITVNKQPGSDWALLKPQVFAAIAEFNDSGDPILLDAPPISDTAILPDDTEDVAMIKEILEKRIRPVRSLSCAKCVC